MAEAAPARFILSSAWMLIKVCGTAWLHGNGTAVDLDFCSEGRALHRYYTSNKTRPLLGEQGRVLAGVGGGHHNEDIFAEVRWHVL